MTSVVPEPPSITAGQALHRIFGTPKNHLADKELPSPSDVGRLGGQQAPRTGACVFLPVVGRPHYYLLERNPADHDTAPGKLRPPGGAAQPHELGMPEETIVREMREEFGLSARQTRPGLHLLGYQKDGQYKGSAVFMMNRHGLKPGTYQASNSPDEQVTLEPASIHDLDYVGPNPADLSSEPPVVPTIEMSAPPEDEGGLGEVPIAPPSPLQSPEASGFAPSIDQD